MQMAWMISNQELAAMPASCLLLPAYYVLLISLCAAC